MDKKRMEEKESLWLNPNLLTKQKQEVVDVTEEQIEEARSRLLRFAPYLMKVFPETQKTAGIIESELREIKHMKTFLNEEYHAGIEGRLLLKMDSDLPIAGSVKARGGIYEVLKHAEDLAIGQKLLQESDDYSVLAEERFVQFFHQYKVQVGSTGNLGLSIGIMSAKLGFQVTVHMSADAKQWKKDLLRSKGVTVIEYAGDYGAAVDEGRRQSDLDPKSYFVDDEKSIDLFLGYAVAGKRLEAQLKEQGVVVDETHPLFVYLPCGIGGAPGGVAYGLKMIYGEHVHCFFTEPVTSCCMLLGMSSGLHDAVCVQDYGLSGVTAADGLAVSRPSAFVGRIMQDKLSGIATIDDERLFELMKILWEREHLFIEHSACAAFAALIRPDDLKEYAEQHKLTAYMKNAVHIPWATGGSLMPEDVRSEYLNKAADRKISEEL